MAKWLGAGLLAAISLGITVVSGAGGAFGIFMLMVIMNGFQESQATPIFIAFLVGLYLANLFAIVVVDGLLSRFWLVKHGVGWRWVIGINVVVALLSGGVVAALIVAFAS